MAGPTLVEPPPADTSKSPMENVLELTALSVVQPDLFTNTRELWHPPGARGVYGGAVVAQSLAAAFMTVPPPSPENKMAVFLPHSVHCYFVLAGDSNVPILYHVERVRESRSFLTRTVQAKQKGKCIFTTTISFMKEGSGGQETIQHGWDLPSNAEKEMANVPEEDKCAKTGDLSVSEHEAAINGVQTQGPFISKRLGIYNDDSPLPQARKPQTWIKCRGSLKGGVQAHLAAIAYMSDSWFIGTIIRIHHLERWAVFANSSTPFLRKNAKLEMADRDAGKGHKTKALSGTTSVNTPAEQPTRRVGMMVSLDHTIYFHRPREIRADEWMLSEMESPWSGEGRALVMQRIWNKEGRLVATCVQEGLARLERVGGVDVKGKL